MNNIYSDIAQRTGGNIYIGIIGPVRTGKSTLVKRLMEELVIPGMEDPQRKARARDELPQSGSGRTITTSEPKFVPEEAAEICPDGTSKMKVRLIDSVGYMVSSAVGATEDGRARMVNTPWSEAPIPMEQAARIGTQKVMREHATIGIVVTTDGTVTDIPRQDYVQAEREAIEDIRATGKPFLTLINTTQPSGEAAYRLREELKEKYGVDAAIADCQAMDAEGIAALLQDLLYSFPMTRMDVMLPDWLSALQEDGDIRSGICQGLLKAAQEAGTLGQVDRCLQCVRDLEPVQQANVTRIDPATGRVQVEVTLPRELYFETLSKALGTSIQSEAQLIRLLTRLIRTEQEYLQVADALRAAQTTGYGVVMPTAEQLHMEQPQILKKGAAYGVRLKAGAPAIHMLRIDIDTELTPMVGDEKHSRELLEHLSSEDPASLWQSNLFGKSVYELVQEGLNAKLLRTPEDVKSRFRSSLERIVNEGANGLICIIL